MSDAGFTLLWSKTLRSSLWVKESKETRLVWLTMLMLKNADGVVICSLPGLADAAKVTEGECDSALSVLLSPDPKSTSKAEEGRRVLEVEGGWRIVNSDLYRFSSEAKRAFWAQQKAEQRAKLEPKKKRAARKGPQAGETAYVKTLEREGPAAADAQVGKAWEIETPECVPEETGVKKSVSVNDFEDHVKERLSSPKGLAAQAALVEEQRAGADREENEVLRKDLMGGMIGGDGSPKFVKPW